MFVCLVGWLVGWLADSCISSLSTLIPQLTVSAQTDTTAHCFCNRSEGSGVLTFFAVSIVVFDVCVLICIVYKIEEQF